MTELERAPPVRTCHARRADRASPLQLPRRALAYPARPVYRSRTALSRAQNGTVLRSPGTPSPSPQWTIWTRERKAWSSLPGEIPTLHPKAGPQRPQTKNRRASATRTIDHRAARHWGPPWPGTSSAHDPAPHRRVPMGGEAMRRTLRRRGAKMRCPTGWTSKRRAMAEAHGYARAPTNVDRGTGVLRGRRTKGRWADPIWAQRQ